MHAHSKITQAGLDGACKVCASALESMAMSHVSHPPDPHPSHPPEVVGEAPWQCRQAPCSQRSSRRAHMPWHCCRGARCGAAPSASGDRVLPAAHRRVDPASTGHHDAGPRGHRSLVQARTLPFARPGRTHDSPSRRPRGFVRLWTCSGAVRAKLFAGTPNTTPMRARQRLRQSIGLARHGGGLGPPGLASPCVCVSMGI